MTSASERRYLMGTGKPLLDIHNKYSTRAFSSDGLRYCWLFAFSYIEGRSCARFHRVMRGTVLHVDRAAYVLGSIGSRPSDSATLAGSILHLVMVMAKGKERRAALGSRLGRTRRRSYRNSWNLTVTRFGTSHDTRNKTARYKSLRQGGWLFVPAPPRPNSRNANHRGLRVDEAC